MGLYLGLADGQTIPEGYEKYIWISDRCTEGIAWCRNRKKNYRVISSQISDSDKVISSIQYLKRARKHVTETAVELLNTYHGVSYRPEEWNYLIGYWISIYLYTLYEKFLRIKAYENYGEPADCGIINTESFVPPLDFAEYLEMVTVSDSYHLMLYSELLEEMDLNKSIRIIGHSQYVKQKFDYSGHIKSKYKTWLYKKMILAFKSITRKQDKVVMWHCYFPKNYSLKLMRMGKGLITDYITNWYLLDRPYLPEVIDRNWRKSCFAVPKELDEFETIACRLLKKHFPATFVENFKYLAKRMQQDYKYAMKPNAILFSCADGQADEIFKVYLMKMKRKGVKICDIQHGGNYGIDYLWSSHIEYDSCDVFYTWGWKPNENRFRCQFKPMPAAKIFNGVLDNVKRGNYILYVNYLYSKYPIEPSARTENHASSQKAEIDFFRSLGSGMKQKMRIRLYPSDYGWNFAQRLKDAVPDLIWDQIEDYYDSLNQAKLVVLSDWSTTIAEALAANKPVLILRNCETEEEACEDIIQLEHAGVIVNKWGDLKKQLEDISRDIDKWWNDSARQQIIQRIKEKYVYYPKGSEQIWQKEILGLISG